MVFDGITAMNQITAAYSYLNSGKRKERFDVILEPLQAVSQLAYLKACPIGTKLSIENNLMFLQMPHWHQGLSRAWNKDKREDILLLFNAMQRFNKIYVADAGISGGNGKPSQYKKLIDLVTKMAIAGIDNLLNTYSRVENTSIVQTLVMYKNILNYPDRFSSLEEMRDGSGSAGRNIEEVFAQIRDNWTDNEMAILYHTLQLIDSDSVNAESYIAGINQIFQPLHARIRKWMSDNIVY